MAKSLDNLIKQGSQLFENKVTPLSNKAGKLGTPVPQNPMESSVIGANADQAKMAGTPAQTTNALRQTSDRLTRQESSRQPKSYENTEAEKAKVAQAASLQGLGHLNDAVQSKILGKISQPGDGVAVPQISEESLEQFKEDFPELESVGHLNKILAGNATLTDYADIANELGINFDTTTPEAFADTFRNRLNKYIDNGFSLEDAVSQSVVDSTELTVSEFAPEDWEEWGVDATGMADVLGLSLSELGTLNISELNTKVNDLIANNFDEVRELKLVLSDPTAPASLKAEAQAELRRMGATGERMAEVGMERLQQEIEGAETVKVGGETMSIEQLLSDENISSQVNKYLTGSPEDRQKVEEIYGSEFGEWIESHKEALTEATEGMSEDVKALADIQLANREALEIEGAPQLSSEVLDILYPNRDKITADSLSKLPLTSFLQSENIPGTSKAAAVAAIESLKDRPEALEEFKGLTEEEIFAKFGGGKTFASNVAKLKTRLDDYEALQSYEGDDLVDELFGNILGNEGVTEYIKSALAKSAILGNKDEALNLITDAQGTFIGPGALKDLLLERLGKPSAESFSSEENSLERLKREFSEEMKRAKSPTGLEYKLKDYIEDGELSIDEVGQYINTLKLAEPNTGMVNIGSAEQVLADLRESPGVSPAIVEFMDNTLTDKVTAYGKSVILNDRNKPDLGVNQTLIDLSEGKLNNTSRVAHEDRRIATGYLMSKIETAVNDRVRNYYAGLLNTLRSTKQVGDTTAKTSKSQAPREKLTHRMEK